MSDPVAVASALKEEAKAAISPTKEDMAALSPEDRAAIARRKNANVVAAQMAGTSWGKGVDPVTQRAVADWGSRHGIDVTTEIHILGGNIYLNAQFYINRLIDLVRLAKVLDFRQRYINHDQRLVDIQKEVLPPTASQDERDELAKLQGDARREVRERQRLRVQWNVPDAATSAVLTEVVLVSMPHTPFFGVKWAPRNGKDPIGAEFPQETALTRSARRALKLCIRYLPEVAEYVQGAEEDAFSSVSSAIAEGASKRAATDGVASENRQLNAGDPTNQPKKAEGLAQAEYVVEALKETPHAAARSLTPTDTTDPYAADKAPPRTSEELTRAYDAVLGTPPMPAGDASRLATALVTENLFGDRTPMEPAAPADDDLDDTASLTPEERAEADLKSRRQ